jgi:hypothetical protein
MNSENNQAMMKKNCAKHEEYIEISDSNNRVR